MRMCTCAGAHKGGDRLEFRQLHNLPLAPKAGPGATLTRHAEQRPNGNGPGDETTGKDSTHGHVPPHLRGGVQRNWRGSPWKPLAIQQVALECV